MDTPMEKSKEKTPAMATVVVDGVEHSVPVQVAKALTKVDAAPVQETPAETPKETKMIDENKQEATALRARVDVLEAELAGNKNRETARIDARVNLVTTARGILGADHKTDGVEDAPLMREVILHVSPNLKGRLDANADDEGYLRASYEAAVDLNKDRESVADEISNTLFSAMVTDESKVDLNAEHAAYIARLQGRGGEAN
jgi:hypothetical protein